MTLMMERVVDPEDGVAPLASVPGYRVAGKTGTAQRVGTCGNGAASTAATTAPTRSPSPASPRPRTRGSPSTSSSRTPKIEGARRWRHRRPGVLEADGLRAPALRRPAEPTASRRSCPSSGRPRDTGRVVSAQTRPARPPRDAARRRSRTGCAARRTTSPPRGDLDTVVTGLTLSSQRTFPGDLYAALPGSPRARDRPTPPTRSRPARSRCSPTRRAPRPRRPAYRCWSSPSRARLLGRLAAHVYGDPAAAMRMIGVTGTQGKTTTTRLAEGGLQRAGHPGRRDRHRRHPDRGGGGEDLAHHARGARPARAVRGDARARGRPPARWR